MFFDRQIIFDNTFLARLFLFSTAVLSCILVWYGAAGLRGTDQYWYIADVLTISQGLESFTNNFFPGPMLRNGIVPAKNYFMHNSPVMFPIGWLSRFIDAYNAWILTNVACHAIVAGCIFYIAVRYTTTIIAMIVTGFYLISPIAIWQTINPLLEMYYSSLVAMQLLCFCYRERSLFRYGLYVSLIVGLASHPIFFVPACIWAVLDFIASKNKKTGLIIFSLFSIGSYLVLQGKDVWFPSSFQPELKAIIASVVPGRSNMYWHYSEILPVVDLHLMKNKVLYALQKHFFTARFAPLYIFTNVALIVSCYLVIFRLKKWWRLLIPFGVFGGQYIAMIFLQQNHPRYQQIVAAVVFCVIAIGMFEIVNSRKISKRKISAGVGVCVGVLFLMSLAIVHSGRNQSRNEGQEVERLVQEVSVLPADARIVGIDVKPHNPFSFIVRPRNMLFIRTDMLNESQIDRAIKLFDPTYFFVSDNKYKVSGKLIVKLDTRRFGELFVYEVN